MAHGTPVQGLPIGGGQGVEEGQSQVDHPSPGAAQDGPGLQAKPAESSSTAFSVQTGDDEAEAIASLAETFQTAIDAVNRRYDAFDIWKDPQIGRLLMRVIRGIDRVRMELRSERSTERAMPRVLVVDDMQDVLVTVGAFLAKAGYSVIKASNGEQALQVIASDPDIGLLISDFVMPGMNGAELVAQATRLRPHLRGLLITAYPGADGIEDIAPLVTILPKPFRRDVLMAAVRNLLDGGNAGSALASGSSSAAERPKSESAKAT
jgi:CheY-like chemotaxis protein